MAVTFRIPGAEPLELEPGDEPVPLQVWLGRLRGELVGVLTDPPATMAGIPQTEQSARLHHISGIQGVLLDDRLQAVTGIDPRDVVSTVSRDLNDIAFSASVLTVDSRPVPAATTTYRGLDFAFGCNYREFPIVVVKKAGIGVWPDILTSAPSR